MVFHSMSSPEIMKLLPFLSVFPILQNVHGKSIWSSSPATYSDIIQQAYPIGNGRLGAMPFGPPGQEGVVLNIDSLWSGGPFESSSYIGGNPTEEKSQYLPGIREWIFQNGTGNVSELLGGDSNYGSYQVYANLSVSIEGVSNATSYRRELDFETGLHTTEYTANDGNNYTTTVYCSYPDQVCVYHLSSNNALPMISIGLENLLVDSSLLNQTCGNQFVRLSGITQEGPPEGMKYDGLARLITLNGTTTCNPNTGSLTVPAGSSQELTLVIAAGTNFNQSKGNTENNFSFKGEDPASYVEAVDFTAATKPESELRSAHTTDYTNLMSQFTLTLPDPANSTGLELSEMIERYSTNENTSDPYLESLLFTFGRHLFISAQRDNSLPANLAGKWSETLTAAWSGDYHANINFQMNHWGMSQTGLGALTASTWDYIERNWVPRGTETAKLLYGAPGWVTHDEMNIFGYTGMKDVAQWANYPASAAWMMQIAYDHFSYDQNVTWLQSQGYPLMKGVAEFWLSQLEWDEFFHDGTLVVNNCNSPEHGPTTFGCTNYQQLIHQLFTNILSSVSAVPDLETDDVFITNITSSLKHLDEGLHIGSSGEVKEWKIPDSFGYDVPHDIYRHLSNLVGWYPSSSLSSLLGGYTNTTIQDAVRVSLINRGNGTGPDADAGWEKIWRSTCWALLNDTEMAYSEFRYAIRRNFQVNGLDMYSAHNEPFQVDANFGLVGAVTAMLVVDFEGKDVLLGPAIPAAWGNGSVMGLRLRGGGSVDFGWNEDGLVRSAVVKAGVGGVKRKVVNIEGRVLGEL